MCKETLKDTIWKLNGTKYENQSPDTTALGAPATFVLAGYNDWVVQYFDNPDTETAIFGIMSSEITEAQSTIISNAIAAFKSAFFA